MTVHPLTPGETANLTAVNDASSTNANVFVTATQLDKSIIDATEPIRLLLVRSGTHNFAEQRQGQHWKKLVDAVIVTDHEAIVTKASLYRPATKQGDPRIWFRGLKSYARNGDVLSIVAHAGTLYVFNLSQSSVSRDLGRNKSSTATQVLGSIRASTLAPAVELLRKLREVASHGRVRAIGTGDTAVGRTLETLLNIRMNASRAPDFKGIEIKAHRAGLVENRQTLFARVPDWSRSRLKSSRALLEAFGPHTRTGQLHVTIEARTNAQGLSLRTEDSSGTVYQESDRFEPRGRITLWNLIDLQHDLAVKHKETFWVRAERSVVDGIEFFRYSSVVHTREPVVTQFSVLIALRKIQLDLTINRTGRDHGYLWRMWRKDFPFLFPPEQEYSLML